MTKIKKVTLDNFTPREYQEDFVKNFDERSYNKYLLLWHRRSGKDICAFNMTIRHALRKVGNYFYILPTFAQCRRVIWNSITDDGRRILDFLPKEIIKKKNSSEMRIELINGSMIQLCGSDNYDRLMGVNFAGCVFSEMALQNPDSYKYLRPIMVANGAWSVYISTARGKNFFYKMYKAAINNPDQWYCSKLTIDDTDAVDKNQIAQDIKEGIMSWEEG